MKTEPAEFYSDASNAAIRRNTGRRFPGVLIQGDTLNSKMHLARRLQKSAAGLLDEHASGKLADLADWLDQLLSHDKVVLKKASDSVSVREMTLRQQTFVINDRRQPRPQQNT